MWSSPVGGPTSVRTRLDPNLSFTDILHAKATARLLRKPFSSVPRLTLLSQGLIVLAKFLNPWRKRVVMLRKYTAIWTSSALNRMLFRHFFRISVAGIRMQVISCRMSTTLPMECIFPFSNSCKIPVSVGGCHRRSRTKQCIQPFCTNGSIYLSPRGSECLSDWAALLLCFLVLKREKSTFRQPYEMLCSWIPTKLIDKRKCTYIRVHKHTHRIPLGQ